MVGERAGRERGGRLCEESTTRFFHLFSKSLPLPGRLPLFLSTSTHTPLSQPSRCRPPPPCAGWPAVPPAPLPRRRRRYRPSCGPRRPGGGRRRQAPPLSAGGTPTGAFCMVWMGAPARGPCAASAPRPWTAVTRPLAEAEWTGVGVVLGQARAPTNRLTPATSHAFPSLLSLPLLTAPSSSGAAARGTPSSHPVS